MFIRMKPGCSILLWLHRLVRPGPQLARAAEQVAHDPQIVLVHPWDAFRHAAGLSASPQRGAYDRDLIFGGTTQAAPVAFV